MSSIKKQVVQVDSSWGCIFLYFPEVVKICFFRGHRLLGVIGEKSHYPSSKYVIKFPDLAGMKQCKGMVILMI